MNIGEFIIKIGTQGDTKALNDAVNKMTEAEKKISSASFLFKKT